MSTDKLSESTVIKKEEVKKILIIKLRGIGDVVLSTITFDNLKSDFPEATIDFLTDSSSKPGIEGLPQISRVIIFPKGFLARLKLFYNIRKYKYDLVLDFFSNPSTAQITFFSRAKYRGGFPYQGRKWAYNIFGPPERDKFHNAQLHLEFLKNLNLKNDLTNLYFYVSEADKDFSKRWLQKSAEKSNNLFGILPSGGWSSKKCDPEKFAEIAEIVNNKYGMVPLIIWGPDDYNDAAKIKSILLDKAILAPRTSIREMAALIENCLFVIANDSGPMHISTAINIPVLSLHGPTSPYLQGPFGSKHEWINLSELDCITCNLLECPRNHECFNDLPINRIMEKVDTLITKNDLLG